MLFPQAFENRMKNKLQEEFTEFKEEHLKGAPVSIRMNAKKKQSNVVFESNIPWAEQGRYLATRPIFTLDPCFHGGAYYVQEASSMLLEQVFSQHLNNSEPINVLDLCAAPGGKSTHIVSLLNSNSLLISNEVIRSRASILVENLQKWGYNNIAVTNNDPEDFNQLKGFFDVIVVDAPCSGEGLFRKDAEAMKEWSTDNVMLCASRQKRILHHIWSSLKQNGILIYSTCTYNELENEDNLLWLQQEHDVEFLSLKLNNTWGVQEVTKGKAIGYRLYPHKVKGEGFFLSVIRKKESEPLVKFKNHKNTFSPPSKKIAEQIEPWLHSTSETIFIQRDDLIQCLPKSKYEIIEMLAKNLRLIYAGTFLATVKHNKLIPETTLALSTEVNKNTFPNIELERSESLQYLKKETLNISLPYTGFALITYNGLPLGWVNVLPNRLNNLYPSAWRIRMS